MSLSFARVVKTRPPPDTDIDYSSAIGEFAIGLSPIEGWVPPPVPDPDQVMDKPAGIDRFFDTIQSRLPGITTPAIELELHSIIDEFCFRSTYFRQKIYWQMSIGNSRLILSPYDARMETIYVLNVEGLNNWMIEPPATLVDLQPPLSMRTGEALLILKPRGWDAVRSNAMPTLFSNWWETMLDGTLFRLYGLPAKPWSSDGLAKYHGTRWWQGVNRARDQAERVNSDQQNKARRTFPYFARGRRKS